MHLDHARDEFLRWAGYGVLRVPAALVNADVASAVSLIRNALGLIG